MTISLHNTDNVSYLHRLAFDNRVKVNCIYADCVYEEHEFWWVRPAVSVLVDNGIFIVQTDHHTVFEYAPFLSSLGLTFVNHMVWKNEWGNHPKDRFHQCFDDILIYCKGKEWNFYSDRVQVPKATALTKLNPSGRMTKTATAWIDDICLTTTSKERIKLPDGHLIKWQKPIALLYRILSPWVSEGDSILDPFMGTGTCGVVAKELKCSYIGIERNKDIFEIAKKRIEDEGL